MLKLQKENQQKARFQKNCEKAKNIYLTTGKQRVRVFAIAFSMIISVGVLFSFLLFRYVAIMKANFANVRLEREISALVLETGQIHEAVAKQTDLNAIRLQAVEELGLQTPARNQMVTVHVPQSDCTTYNSRTGGAANCELYGQIETYFRQVVQAGRN